MDKIFNTISSIEELPSYEFTFEKWGAGSYSNLGLSNGHYDIDSLNGKILIRKYAIGYCHGKKLMIRPKPDCVGVMFYKDDLTFWTHLTLVEFNNIFGIVL